MLLKTDSQLFVTRLSGLEAARGPRAASKQPQEEVGKVVVLVFVLEETEGRGEGGTRQRFPRSRTVVHDQRAWR